MNKELVVIEPKGRYIGRIEQPIIVEQKKSLFQQFVDGFKAFCDYAATTKAGSGEMDIGMEPPQSTKSAKKKSRRK